MEPMIIAFIVATWIIFGIFHKLFVPVIDLKLKKDIVLFIMQTMGVTLKPEAILPDINIVSEDQMLSMNTSWNDYGYDPVSEIYFANLNRIYIKEGSGQNLLVHALVHFIQHASGTFEDIGGREAERQAWEVSVRYMRYRYPLNYWFLTIFFGFFHPFTSC